MKNITKIYGNTANETIKSMFNNATLTQPNLTDEQYMEINANTKFIRVGNKEHWADFDNWDDAAFFANSMSGEFMVGLRPYKRAGAVVMATIKK